MNIATKTLAQLEVAVIQNRLALMKLNHDHLLGILRGSGDAPDWASYPRGRDYFTQRP